MTVEPSRAVDPVDVAGEAAGVHPVGDTERQGHAHAEAELHAHGLGVGGGLAIEGPVEDGDDALPS